MRICRPWGKGKILFHIGSAGLKKDFGLKGYTRLVLGVLNRLDGRPVEVVMGPGDEDIALEVRTGTGFVPQMYPLSRLIRILRSFEGTVLCFNSFPAHICQYLGRSAIVMHREVDPVRIRLRALAQPGGPEVPDGLGSGGGVARHPGRNPRLETGRIFPFVHPHREKISLFSSPPPEADPFLNPLP